MRLLARLLTPLAVALFEQPAVRHALIRAIADQEEADEARREARHREVESRLRAAAANMRSPVSAADQP